MVNFFDYDPEDIDVRISELLVATNDESDPLVDPSVTEALNLCREHLNMDVVFVSQFKHNRRTFRVVESKPGVTLVKAGQSDPVEESWCLHVVNGRLPQLMRDARPYIQRGEVSAPPFPIGTHLSTPIRLKDGSVYGTLCCFSQQVEEQVGDQDMQRLRAMARMLAKRLDASHTGGLQLQPVDMPPSRR